VRIPDWLNPGLRIPLPRSFAIAAAASCVLLLLALWTLMTLGEAEQRWMSPSILPSPLEVLKATGPLFSNPDFYKAIAASLYRVMLGAGLAALIGIPLGIAAAAWRPLESFLKPVVLALGNLPVATLIPLTLLWFGIDETQKVMFLVIACVAYVFGASAQAVLAVPERYVDTARTLGASQWQIVTRVLLPLALPDIYRAVRVLIGMAFGYIMLAELINARYGLGYLLQISQRRSLIEQVYLVLFVIGLLAWMIDAGLGWFEQKLFPHRGRA
jgi:NitT/TauT family transport system permease protein